MFSCTASLPLAAIGRIRKRIICGVGRVPDAKALEALKNTKTVDCRLCGDTVDTAASAALSCGHRFCNSCWENWCKAEFDKGPTCVHTRCPEYKCRTKVPDQLQLCSSQRTNDVSQVRARILAAKYKSYAATNFVDGCAKFLKFCPTPNCVAAGQLLDLSLAAGGVGIGVECSCGKGWCWKCKKDDHRPASCEQCEQWTLKNSSDSENVLWILANTKNLSELQSEHREESGLQPRWLCKAKWAGHSNCALYDFGTGKPKAGTQMGREEQAAADAKASLDRYVHYFNRFDNHQKSIKFAEKTRTEAEQRMTKLQALKGVGSQAVQFLMDSVNCIIRTRRVLMWTYPYAYYLKARQNDKVRVLFESHQTKLEELTEQLHSMSEKPLDQLLNNRMRTQIISFTRLLEKYRANCVRDLQKTHDGGGGATDA